MKRFFLFLSFLFIAQIDAAAKANLLYKGLSAEQAIEAYLKANEIDHESDESLAPEVEEFALYKKREFEKKGGSQFIDRWASGLPEQWRLQDGFQENQFDESPQRFQFFHPDGHYSDEDMEKVAQKILQSFQGKQMNANFLELLLKNFNDIDYTIKVMNNLAGLDEKESNPNYEQHRPRYNSKDLHRTILRLMIEQQLIREILGERVFNSLKPETKTKLQKHYNNLNAYWDESDYKYVLDAVRRKFSKKSYELKLAEERAALYESIKQEWPEYQDVKRRLDEAIKNNMKDPDNKALLNEIKSLSEQLGNFDYYAAPTRERLGDSSASSSSGYSPWELE